MSGDVERSLEFHARVDLSILVDLDIDDRFVSTSLALELAEADARFGSADALRSQTQTLCDAYLISRQELLQGLRSLNISFAGSSQALAF